MIAETIDRIMEMPDPFVRMGEFRNLLSVDLPDVERMEIAATLKEEIDYIIETCELNEGKKITLEKESKDLGTWCYV